MQLIRENYMDVVDPEMIAAEVGLTLETFLSRFTLTFNKSIRRVVDELRIQEAKRYLLHGRPLHVAGRNVGIPNPTDLIKLFTKLVGQHPNYWLREFRAKKAS